MKLTIFPEGFSEPSGSPFSVKALCLVEQSGQPYEIERTPDPRKAPKGKFPVLTDGDTVIPDSDHIRDYLEKTYNLDYDDGLSDEQRAISRSLIRMLEEHLYFVIYANRWQVDEHWARTKDIYFNDMPPIIGGMIVKQIRKGAVQQIIGQGTARHSLDEQIARAKKDIDAVSTILGSNKFLFGDRPTAADYSAVPFLRAAEAFPMENKLSQLVQSNSVLMDYVSRGKDALYPKDV